MKSNFLFMIIEKLPKYNDLKKLIVQYTESNG